MKKISVLIAIAFAALATVCDAQTPPYTGAESHSERVFVSEIQSALVPRYAKVAEALKAGYVRYTTADDTGAISYTNMRWTSTGVKYPSQLWYDAQGNLLGADYSIPLSVCKKRPNLWGVNPGRWIQRVGHMHWVTKNASGALSYDQWMPDAKFVAGGGDPLHPSAATLIAMRRVTNEHHVVTIFHLPAEWDLVVWVKANPNGAFADKNPNVTV